ncbi:MAG: SusC/RagA family TonB-linked outer membrane protein [Prevotella sp.]
MAKRFSSTLAGLILCVGTSFAQGKISGKVVSQDDGQPIIGASVIVQGTKTGTVTDVNGNFTLDVPAGKKLVVSYIGMTPQTVTTKPGMTIKLVSDNKTLNEVVVTGMSNVDRRMFTGATAQVKADDAIIGGLGDISRSLEGRVAGVSVQNVSGTFGTAPKIRVRGATSIYGNSKPLWVVDGVVQEDITDISADDLSSGDAETLISSAISGLNSDDIESFQILKDGSATSIYGARAMSGVIVVTTKKGRSGQAHINYTGEFTTRMIPSYSQFNILNSQEQMGIYKEMADKGWLNISDVLNGNNYTSGDYGVYGDMYRRITTYDPTTGQFELANTQEARNAFLQQAEWRNTNWFKKLFSTGVMQNHSLSMSGGTKKSNYYVSMSFMNDPGWYKDSKMNRYTANFNASHHILDNLTFTLLGSASYRKQKAPGTLSQNVDAVTGQVKRDFDINPYSYALNTSRTLDPDTYYQANYAPFNIFNELENNYIDLNVVNTKFQAEIAYNPIADLRLNVVGAVQYDKSSQENNITENSNQAQAYRAMGNTIIRDNNKYLYTDPNNAYALPVTILPKGGFYQRTDLSKTSWDLRGTADYHHKFNGGHFIDVLGGFDISNVDRARTWFNGVGMQFSRGEVPFWVYEFFKKAQEQNTDYYTLSHTHNRTAAFFGTATYSYKQRYNLTGTYRYEGTNRLGRARSARWLPTWNISGSWNADQEPWFYNIYKNVLTHATFRASYSLTADPGPADYTNSTVILKSYNPYRIFSGDRESGIQIDQIANADLTYEKKHELNLGLDLGFLNNRINTTFDIFWRNNYDLIGPTATQGIGGEVVRYANMASMKSRGQELSVQTQNFKEKNFSWTTNLIFSHVTTEVTKLMARATTMDLISQNGFAVVGHSYRGLYSIPYAGLNEQGIPQFYTPDGDITTTDIDFQNRDKNGYLIYEGPTDPTITGSLGNEFRYKNWRLNIFVTYSFGNVIRLDPVFRAYYSDLTAMTKDYRNRFMEPGDEKVTSVPAILDYRTYQGNRQLRYAYNAYNYTHDRIAKGDFIRMKDISLSYDFPKAWFTNSPINDISLKLQATNLFLFYADKKLQGQDPEFINAGGVAAPVPRQYTLTLKVGL